jgi:DNA-binding response OmpR family regulator
MVVVLDDRPPVIEAFVSLFRREGIAACGFHAEDLADWLRATGPTEIAAIEAFIVGEVSRRPLVCRLLRSRCQAVLIATTESRSLSETLELFASGVDDVARKPMHVREMLARIHAIARRARDHRQGASSGDIQVFGDGRDPLVAGEVLTLPRRERRILELLARRTHCWVSKTEIFHTVYGLFNDELDEKVVECQLSRLRRRLRARLGYDPIQSRRFLGYRLVPAEKASLDAMGTPNEPAARPRGETLAAGT